MAEKRDMEEQLRRRIADLETEVAVWRRHALELEYQQKIAETPVQSEPYAVKKYKDASQGK